MERTLEKMVGGSRASVLRSLEGGPRSVGDIVIETRLSQPNVSNHLARLRELGLVIAKRDGRRVFYRIVSPDLVRALLSSPANEELVGAELDAKVAEVRPAFEEKVLEGDHEAARVVIDRALASGLPWHVIYTEVFSPTLSRIGDLWREHTLTTAEERAATNLIDRLVSHVAVLRVPARRAGRCEVVVACPEGERHHIGARMVSDILAADGLNVAFLGADIPSAGILDSARGLQAGVIIVFADSEDHIGALRQLATHCATANGAPDLFVGGRVLQLRPGLSTELSVKVVELGKEALCSSVRASLA